MLGGENQNQSPEDFFAGGANFSTEAPPGPRLPDRLRRFVLTIFSALAERKKLLLIIAAGAILLILTNVILDKLLTNEPIAENETRPAASYKPVAVEKVVVLSRSADTAVAVVHIRNTNKRVGVSTLNYTWQSHGAHAASGAGRTFILPEQDRFLVIPVKQGVPGDVAVELAPHADRFKEPLLSGAELKVINLNGENTTEGFVITGQVSNNTSYTLYTYDLTALVRDTSGNIIGAVATQMENISPGQFKNFRLVWPKPIENYGVLDVRAAANTLSRVNFDLYFEANGDKR